LAAGRCRLVDEPLEVDFFAVVRGRLVALGVLARLEDVEPAEDLLDEDLRLASDPPLPEEPRDDVERRMAAVWQRVMRIERIGAVDDFFELGGHSLLATQVVSHVRLEFSVEVSLRELFERPTVRGLSEVVRERLSAGAINKSEIVRAERAARRLQHSVLREEELQYEV